MSDLSSKSFDQGQNSDIIDDDFENDDLITFEHNSKKINFSYSKLTKYSKQIREEYLFSDVVNRIPQEIERLQESSQLLPENVDLFFELLEQNYEIKEKSKITYIECIDLLKICKFLEIRKLSYKIKEYIKTHNNEVEFIIQILEYEHKTNKGKYEEQNEINKEMETILTTKINEFLSNEKFKELPIEIIYRILKTSSSKEINSNKLFDIIKESLDKYCVLFRFLELENLSEDRLSELCEIYSKSNENTLHFFDYLKCNLILINEINHHKKNLEEKSKEQSNQMKNYESIIASLQNQLNETKELNKEQENQIRNIEASLQKQINDSKKTNSQLQKQINDSEKVNSQLQTQLNESKEMSIEQQNKMKNLETSLQKQLNDSEKANSQLKSQLNEQRNKMKDLETSLQNQIKYSKDLENQISQHQKQNIIKQNIIKQNIELPIKGEIVASIENGFIKAEIKLETEQSTLDTTKSKVIISTSDAEYLGEEAYEKGELITSPHMNTTFVRKSGKYYVRSIVFNTEGKSTEIVSNSVTTNGNSLTFGYEGKPRKIILPQGEYELEVWGAKGGDSTGEGGGNRGKQKIVEGGLGGYSRGILRLNKEETVYVFVGEEGRPSNSSEGSTTKGGFPDGGGTKTGYFLHYTTVPGTGGGSTSIRIGSETDYSRVIVAGGGGGASGCSCFVNPGGFGGGLSGGNCHYEKSLQSQGAGTQTGSTGGLGHGKHGDAGGFGSGATGKYRQGSDSGGGGGGGWYGGGGGGFGGCVNCSSGGGGSGWTFTESSLKEFQSVTETEGIKIELNSSYYLREVKCVCGNEEFPRPDGKGKERGHSGHGYAKITFL